MSFAGPAYLYSPFKEGALTVTARQGTSGNEREFFWRSDAKPVVNSTACAEWVSGDGNAQQGLVFRVVQDDGVVRAISVTRNVYASAQWVFNFHEWDTSQSPAFTLLGHMSLTAFLAGAAPYPLSICGRVTGSLLQFVVWRPGTAQPPWSTTTYGGHATVPSGYDGAGVTGWFVGHVPEGTAASFSGLAVNGTVVDGKVDSVVSEGVRTQRASTGCRAARPNGPDSRPGLVRSRSSG
jgi:hypothetical protein